MNRILSLLISIGLLACQNQQQPAVFSLSKVVTKKPLVVGSNVISKGNVERDFAISKDGDIMMYTIQSPKGKFSTLMYCKKSKGKGYLKPQIANFSGQFSDLEPFFHPIKKELYFSSNRPKDGSKDYLEEDFDIWKVNFTNKTVSIRRTEFLHE